MKKKLMIFIAVCLIGDLAICFYSWTLSAILFFFLIALGMAGIGVLFLNRCYMKTNHWKNQFLFEDNFISNHGYRSNLNRNFDIVNLGSNPARYGFFYGPVKGQNWATGSQGLEMDFEILKYYHSYLKKGGVVLLPIMPFTSISQYIKTKPDYWSRSYYLKFAKILDYSQALQLPDGKNLIRTLKYPVLYDPKLLRYLFHDSAADMRLLISEQTMQGLEMEQDAEKWIQGWMREFDVSSMQEFLSRDFGQYWDEAKTILRDMIRFCKERELVPVFITVPMSKCLAAKFSMNFRDKLIKDFINEVNTDQIPFLDYMFDARFADPSWYNGSFFLNLRGRKAFSAQVIQDLKQVALSGDMRNYGERQSVKEAE